MTSRIGIPVPVCTTSRSRRVLSALLVTIALASPSAFAIAVGTAVSQASFTSSYGWAVELASSTQADAGVCGGELLSPTWVLSVAHCSGQVIARVGGTDLADQTQISIDSYIVDPNYNPTASNGPQYDVALYHLATPVFNTTPVQLATTAQASSLLINNAYATIAGWGATPTSDPSPTLIAGSAHLTGLDRTNYGTLFLYVNSANGPCGGDSGGPMIRGGVLVGIATATDANYCANQATVAAYTDVAKIRGFIEANVSDLGATLVPLPAGAWLFPSALLALLRVRRRQG